MEALAKKNDLDEKRLQAQQEKLGNKFRSPGSHKLRKKTKAVTPSTGTTGTTPVGSIMSSDSEDVEEGMDDDEEEDGGAAGSGQAELVARMMALKEKMKDDFEDTSITWATAAGNGPNKHREFQEAQPLVNVMEYVGPNATLDASSLAVLHASRLDGYMLVNADYDKAMNAIRHLMTVRKKQQAPGKVLDALPKSYQVHMQGKSAPQRKLWGPLWSLVLARRDRGMTLPAITAAFAVAKKE